MSGWLATEYGVLRWSERTGRARLVKVHGAVGEALQQATALAHAHPGDIITLVRQEVLRFGWESDPGVDFGS